MASYTLKICLHIFYLSLSALLILPATVGDQVPQYYPRYSATPIKQFIFCQPFPSDDSRKAPKHKWPQTYQCLDLITNIRPNSATLYIVIKAVERLQKSRNKI